MKQESFETLENWHYLKLPARQTEKCLIHLFVLLQRWCQIEAHSVGCHHWLQMLICWL